jgi:hypothetical protein
MSKRRNNNNDLDRLVQRAFAKGAPKTQSIAAHEGGETKTITQQVSIRSIPIMFGIPMDETMFSRFFVMFYRNVNFMPWDSICTSMGTLVATARNEIHKAFLTTELPYLMMLDSDIMCPPGIIEKLLAHNKPIVGGFYRSKQVGNTHPVIYDFLEEKNDEYVWRHRQVAGSGLEQVQGMGAGCWLMSREVALALGEKPYSHDKCGEDLMVCKKLMDLEIPLFVDWNLPCAHLGVSYA